MCIGGPAVAASAAPMTPAQMEAETDNPYENPVSGTTDPSWKKQDTLKANVSQPDGQSQTQTQSERYG